MGARKTGRKKKSEYKKYKKFLKGMKSAQQAMFIAQNVVATAQQLAVMQNMRVPKFDRGGVSNVQADHVDMVVNIPAGMTSETVSNRLKSELMKHDPELFKFYN
jgi:hypothetical protein